MTTSAIFVLFGSTGDLAQKKIMPALFKLYQEGRMNPHSSILAFSRRDWSNDEYRKFITPSLEKVAASPQALQDFLQQITYTQGQFQDAQSYHTLRGHIEHAQDAEKSQPVFYYLSVQPEFYLDIVHGLSSMSLLKDFNAKILVEKPFGHDLSSAQALEKHFEKNVQADHVLRIDHYLAKEGLQKISEAAVNPADVAKIVVQMNETIGIEGRGEFYETIGAIRDVGQNHLLQMLATVLMDHTASDKNKARAEALHSLSIVGTPFLGQYDGYLDEEDVASDSHVETYFKINAESSLPMWKGIPIILEAGKAINDKRTAVTLIMKDGTQKIFDIQASPSGRDAYEILIESALHGNHSLFASMEEILASWQFFEPILKNRATLHVHNYPKGSNGPQ